MLALRYLMLAGPPIPTTNEAPAMAGTLPPLAGALDHYEREARAPRADRARALPLWGRSAACGQPGRTRRSNQRENV